MTEEPTLDYRVVSGNPDHVELAAVAAVLSRAIEEHAADDALREESTSSAWDRSKRSMRSPLHPGPGYWRGFSG